MTNTKERDAIDAEAAALDDLFCMWESGGSGPRETGVADLVRRARAAGAPPPKVAEDLRELVRMVNQGAIDPDGFEAVIA